MTSALPRDEAEVTPLIGFAGAQFVPLVSGALYWPELDALLVADLHLEKHSSFARTGQLLPPYDTGMTLRRLERDLMLTRAERVFALGDSFHRDEGTSTLLPGDRAHLKSLTDRADWTWLSGNHDPAPHTLGGACCAELGVAGCHLTHEPRRGIPGLIAGHLHPAARVAMNGKSSRRACFVWDDEVMILPAYGASTGSLNVLSPAFHGLIDRKRMQVMLLGRGRVYPASASRLVNG